MTVRLFESIRQQAIINLLIAEQMNNKKRLRVKRLQGTSYVISMEEKIGKGSFGEVYMAYNKDYPSQSLVAKIINLHQSDNRETIEAELSIIKELPRQQNLVNCQKLHIESQNNLYIIMEYCNGGSLQKYISEMKLMSEDKIWDFLTQFCRGYQVLLDANLIHRDIKPDNILINDGIFKIADFGLSKRVKNPSLIQNLSFKGSPLYIAPQIIDNKQGCSKVDVFSLGCVIYQLAYDGAHPFYNESKGYNNIFDYFEHMKKGELVLKQKNKKGQVRSLQLRQLISLMVQKDHQKRISWQKIFAYAKININKLQVERPARPNNERQKQLEQLRSSLVQVNKSSAKIQEYVEKDNVREQTNSITLELIQFQQKIAKHQFKQLQRLIFRLKITFLTIIHCNHKINYVIRENLKNKRLHRHIIDGMKKVATQGLLYLLKNIDIINSKISNYEANLVDQIKIILNADRQRIIQEYQKESKIFKNIDAERFVQAIKTYDLRNYQHSLYNLLTEYCDFSEKDKNYLKTIISILIDIYDSELKLTEITQTEKIFWDKSSQIEEAETKMDEICLNKCQPQQFHNYLMGKQHISEQQINQSLKRMGLLFE